MKSYVKPLVLDNDEIFEGVYAASGSVADGEITGGVNGADGANGDVETTEEVWTSDCWTVGARSVQDWDGANHVFEIEAYHNKENLKHISGATIVTLTFSAPIVAARSEFECSFSGNVVTVTRTLLADAYLSGDQYTYKVWVQASDEATTKAIACTQSVISCKHEVNVQGEFD